MLVYSVYFLVHVVPGMAIGCSGGPLCALPIFHLFQSTSLLFDPSDALCIF